MSVWGNEARTRVPRIAEAAVERARLTVVPRVPRSRAARMPFVVLVSLLLVGGVAGLLCFNTSMQQSSFQVTALEDEATARPGPVEHRSTPIRWQRHPGWELGRRCQEHRVRPGGAADHGAHGVDRQRP